MTKPTRGEPAHPNLIPMYVSLSPVAFSPQRQRSMFTFASAVPARADRKVSAPWRLRVSFDDSPCGTHTGPDENSSLTPLFFEFSLELALLFARLRYGLVLG